MNGTKVDTRRIAILIGAVVLMIIIISLISGGDKNKQEQKPEQPFEARVIEGEQLAESKEYKGLEISNVKFEIEEKMTEVTADVINNTGKDMERQYVNINILDKDGNKIMDIGGYIGAAEAGGTTKMIGSYLTSEETKNAHNVEITDKKEQDTDTINENAHNTSNSSSDDMTI